MMGVNVAGIFVYDRRDQVQRKLFAVIRICSSTSLRVQDERSKLVFLYHFCTQGSTHKCEGEGRVYISDVFFPKVFKA